MVSKLNTGDKFFTIKTRDSTLRVPQKIFPESQIINDILKSDDKSDVSFYVNRSANDMCEVINFLSGQTYDKNKMNIIEEILQQDFKINVKTDEKKNDDRKRIIDFDENKESAILSMWNDFIDTTQFVTTVCHDPRKNSTLGSEFFNKNIFEATHESHKIYGDPKINYMVQTMCDISDIETKYQEISKKFRTNVILEIIKLLEMNYRFIKINTNVRVHKKLFFSLNHFSDLKDVVRNVFDTDMHAWNVSFYLK
jgi:hypothetical protein